MELWSIKSPLKFFDDVNKKYGVIFSSMKILKVLPNNANLLLAFYNIVSRAIESRK